jgi:hypothetical protein
VIAGRPAITLSSISLQMTQLASRAPLPGAPDVLSPPPPTLRCASRPRRLRSRGGRHRGLLRPPRRRRDRGFLPADRGRACGGGRPPSGACQPRDRVCDDRRCQARDRGLRRGDPARAGECNAYFNRGLAFALRGKGDLDRALADYDRAIKLDPKQAKAYVARGLAFFGKGDLDRGGGGGEKGVGS